jgi:hypothetical protein
MLWQEGPWELPKPAAAKAPAGNEEGPATKADRPLLADAKNIIERNLFDPERGATKVAEVASAALQRIRSLVLLGTAVIGDSRYAVFLQPSESPAVKTPQTGQMRLKLGESFEGFRMSEIQDRRVVFTKGGSQVEVSLDFFRKFDDAREKVKAPAPVPPRIAPRIPIPRRAGGEAPAKEQE